MRLRTLFNNAADNAALGLVTLAASLIMGSSCAHAQQDGDAVPARAVEVVGTAADTTANTTMASTDPKLFTVEALLEEFGRSKLGEKLIFYAEVNGISIQQDFMFLFENNLSGLYTRDPDIAWVQATLSDDEKLYVLAHELFHGRQDHDLGINKMEERFLTPEQHWALRQYGEAEGLAFGAFFMADRARELGVPLPDPALHPAFGIAAQLYEEFSSSDGLTPREYRDLGFRPAFAYLSAYHGRLKTAIGQAADAVTQDMNTLDSLQRIGENTDALIEKYKARVASTPSDAEFEKFLRRFGSTAVERDAPTAFEGKDLTYQQLLRDIPQTVAANIFIQGAVRRTLSHFMEKSGAAQDAAREKIAGANGSSALIRPKTPPRATN